jgi:hypothetical protein
MKKKATVNEAETWFCPLPERTAGVLHRCLPGDAPPPESSKSYWNCPLWRWTFWSAIKIKIPWTYNRKILGREIFNHPRGYCGL